ncbi:unnamed protein product, partial [Echinostoma caproni]|uniref:Uncharacterized protein n=1 Tax=Echinostoma caproni TaxID=27848 RepID=A0A183A0L4_9TREM
MNRDRRVLRDRCSPNHAFPCDPKQKISEREITLYGPVYGAWRGRHVASQRMKSWLLPILEYVPANEAQARPSSNKPLVIRRAIDEYTEPEQAELPPRSP